MDNSTSMIEVFLSIPNHSKLYFVRTPFWSTNGGSDQEVFIEDEEIELAAKFVGDEDGTIK